MRYLAIIFLILTLIGCNSTSSESQDKTPQTEVEQSYNSYGEEINNEGVISASELLTNMESTDSMNVKLEASILQTCSKKGCWMDVDMGNGSTMKVRFKDYGFFVPKEGMEGKQAVMEGMVIREVVDVETLRHYAEDAGKDESEIEAITEPEIRLSFTASGVLIEN